MSSLVFSLIKALPKFDPTVFSLTGVTTLGKGTSAAPWVILGGSPFDFAQFWAQLTYSLVLDRGIGTPTYTGGVATGSAIQDNEGVLRFRGANEAGFSGARRVKNLLTYTEDFSNAAWTKIKGGTGATPVATNGFTAPDGTATAWRIQLDVVAGTGAGDYSIMRESIVGSSFLRSCWVKSNTASSQLFNFTTGTSSGIVTATTSWQRLSAANAVTVFDIGIAGADAVTKTVDILIWHPQAEDITGRTDQTTPSEYVSVGATPINLCLQSNAFTTTWTEIFSSAAATQNVTDPFGIANSAWTITDDQAGGTEGKIQAIILTAVPHTFSVFIKKTIGAQGNYPVIYAYTGAVTPVALATIDTSNGIATAWTAFTGSSMASGISARCTSYNADFWRAELTFTATAASWTVGLVPATTSVADYAGPVFTAALTGSAVFYGAQLQLGSTATTYIPTTTVAKAYGEYHGLGVDGVKDFPTDLTGAPIPLTTLKGYQAEPAATNLCLQSNALTTTWTQVSSPATTQNAVGPDGGTTAWTLTDSSVVLTAGISQNITLTAAAHTMSVFVKKTIGAQASYPVLYANTGTVIAVVTIDTSNGVAALWGAYSGFTMLTGTSARCTSYNSNFWRVELTYNATVAVYAHLVIPAGSTVPTALNTLIDVAAQGSAVFYGVQVELGSVATSYIPTTTGSVTRAADVLTYPSAGNASATAGALYMEASVPYLGGAPQIQIDDGSNNNRVLLDDGNVNGGSRVVVSSGGSIYANYFDFSSAINAQNKRVARWAANDIQSAQNGVLGTGDTSVTVPVSFTRIGVGGNGGSSVGPQNLRNLRIWQRALSNSELQAITT